MFEDTPQKNSMPPKNLPSEPVDMFSEVEKEDSIPGPSALEAGALKKKPYGAGGIQTPPADMAGETVSYSVHEPVLGKVIMIVIILIIASGVGYGGWRLYSYFTTPSEPGMPKMEEIIIEQPPATTITEPIPTEISNETPTTSLEDDTMATTSPEEESESDLTPIISQGIDTDKDGLDDAQEEQLGTDMNKTDTDSDTLSDGDEVLIWQTNPLNPDTDGDGYLDGEEIRNGYSPTGPGKLFNGGTSPTSTTTTTSAETTTTTETEEEPII